MKTPSQINGTRPSPLTIHKDSHQISKPPPAAAQPRRRNPVIIYTYSPKIIHTKPGDFMALVQGLTGMIPPSAAVAPPDLNDADVSSVLTDDNSGGMEPASPATNRVIDSIFGDFPLFTPNSAADFFCSPRRSFIFGGGASPNALSPSVMEFMKGLPEY